MVPDPAKRGTPCGASAVGSRPLKTRLFALVLALATTGCFSPYFKRASASPEPKPSPALVAGFVVHFNDNTDKSVLSAAVDLAQNAGLDEFGRKASEMFAQAIEKHGYTAAWDGPRSARLDAVQISSNASTAALTGQWRHPDSSYWVPQTVDSLFMKPADLIAKVTLPDATAKEYYAFADVAIADGGMFLKEPVVIVRAVIYDAASTKVVELGGIGSGTSSFMFADRSPNNLQAALQNAFDSLQTVAEQPL